MAQEFRPLVITDGVQKRLPDNNALEVGPGGLVAKNDGNIVKMVIGAEGNVDDKPIELQGNAHFLRDVKIQGELEVVGDATLVESFVSKSIFQQTVQFGDGSIDGTNTQDKAEFAATIQMHTGHAEGAFLKTAVGSLALDAENALLDMDGNSVELRSDSTLQIDSADASHFQMTANAAGEKILSIRAQNDGAGTGKLSLSANGAIAVSTPDAAYSLNANSSTETIYGDSTENVDNNKDVNAANIFLDSSGKVLVTAGALQLDPQFETNGVGTQDAAVAAEGKFLVRADDKIDMVSHGGISGLTHAQDISLRAGANSAAMSNDVANSGLGQMHLSSLKLMQLDSQASMQLDADAASHFKTSAGDITVDSEAANLVLHAAQAIKADASGSSWLKTDTGNLNLEANAANSALIVKSGDKVSVEAGTYSALATKEQNSGADALLMSAEGAAFLSADGDIEIDSESSVNVFAGTAAAWQTAALPTFQSTKDVLLSSQDNMGVLADAGYLTFNKELSIYTRADVDASDNFVGTGAITVQANAGNVLVNALARLNTVDPAAADDARGGNLTLTADMAFNTLKSVRSGGQMVLSAGKDDLGFIHLKAGKRDTDTWVAPNDGEIELRSQTDMRLRAAGDLRMEVGSTKDVILDDSSAGAFDQTNEVGHARIRNVKDPTHAQDVVTKKYMEENGGGTVKLIAAEALVKGNLVALNGSGKVKKADAASNDYLFGIATHDAALDGEILVRMLGKFQLSAAHGQTPGAPFYMDAAGAASATAPSAEGSSVQRAGLYLAGAEVLMLIGEPVIL